MFTCGVVYPWWLRARASSTVEETCHNSQDGGKMEERERQRVRYSNTASLRYEMEDRNHVRSLNCCVCMQFRQKLDGMRNYNKAYIVGSKNLQASSFKDHTSSEVHLHSMLLLKKQQSTNVRTYAPYARALHVMDSASQQTVERKFDIAFLIAQENMKRGMG